MSKRDINKYEKIFPKKGGVRGEPLVPFRKIDLK
jgi:hypothetical protein